jgi:hypothetical protein
MKIIQSVLISVFVLSGVVSFAQSAPSDTAAPKPVVAQNLLVKGQRDAERHYQKYRGAGTGTLVASLVSPLVGLIPAIACSATAPKETNLGYPKPELFAQEEYYRGYTQKAKKIKQRKVWGNWAIGFGVNMIAVLVISARQR